MTIRNLDRLLTPRSIAVIGASDRPASVGATVWRNVRAARFAGPIYAVNPSHSTLDGEPVYAEPADLPTAPDLALLCSPPDTIAATIGALGQRGTRAAIVMTAGLTRVQKQAMLDAARPHLLRVLGPNCLGMLVPHIGLNASFAHTDALPGDLAFVSQSGALVTAVLDWAKSRRLGFSSLISLGEHADVDFGDLLDHLASDARTRAILLYIESIESPRKFMSAARAAARNKPVIVVKAGRAGNGVLAAASHTGALASSDVVIDAAIRRAGMLRVDTLQDLFMAAETLARIGQNHDASLTLMTNGGGAGVLAADAAALAGVALAPLSDAARARLDAALPTTWSRANPIDIIGDAPVERYVQTLQVLLDSHESGAILFMHAPTAIVPSATIAQACAPLVRQAAGRMLACWLGDASVAEARAIFEQAGAADYATPEEAVRAFAMLATYRRNQAQLLEVPTTSENGAPDLAAARATIDAVLAQGRELLDEAEAKALLRAYRIPTVATLAVDATPAAALLAAQQIGYPVALKIRSPEITHKSDVGGVALDLRDAAALEHAATTMLARVGSSQPQARLVGFTLQTMVQRPGAQELIVGASVDPTFGPVLLFGQGGTAVEVVADRAIALPPLNRALAQELVSRTRVARLLGGFRDHAPVRIDALCDVLIALSQMLADLPELIELDINPLLADADGVIALDARVRVRRGAHAGAASFAVLPYPAELARTLEWRGAALQVRPIRPEDGPAHRRFIDQLAPEDLRLRFFGVRREFTSSELARMTQIDYAREMAFVALRRSTDDTAASCGAAGDELLAVARAAIDPDNVEAEFAIIVASSVKGLGLGHLMMRTVIDYLRRRGTLRMVALVLPENRRMRNLALAHGLLLDEAGSNPGELRYVLELAPAGAEMAS